MIMKNQFKIKKLQMQILIKRIVIFINADHTVTRRRDKVKLWLTNIGIALGLVASGPVGAVVGASVGFAAGEATSKVLKND